MSREQWKSGPGRMEYNDTVELKRITQRSQVESVLKEHILISFDVFNDHVEVWWNVEDDEFVWRTQRHLGDKQKKYLKFLTMLIAYTNYKYLRPEY